MSKDGPRPSARMARREYGPRIAPPPPLRHVAPATVVGGVPALVIKQAEN